MGAACSRDAAPRNKPLTPLIAVENRFHRHGWFLQLDIQNFFNSIHKPTLFRLLQHRLRKAIRQGKISEREAIECRDLCHVLLKQNAKDVTRLGDLQKFAAVPPHKRLGNAGPDHGLPIGNLTSQFFANVYLNELDQFIKHQLKCRYYLRYVDDFILLHQNPQQLRQWEGEIESFLRHQLQLELKAERHLRPVTDGANFLGYIIRPQYILVRRRVVGNLREKLQGFERSQPQRLLRLHRAPREALRATLASYLGHFKHAAHVRLIQQVFDEFPWLHLLFRFNFERFELTPLWQPPLAVVCGYKSQVAWFRRQYPQATLWVQRGREMDRFALNRPVGAACSRDERDEAGPGVSRLQAASTSRLKTAPTATIVVVREAGYLKGGLKRRLVTKIHYLPQGAT